jgi:hypothetical protein
VQSRGTRWRADAQPVSARATGEGEMTTPWTTQRYTAERWTQQSGQGEMTQMSGMSQDALDDTAK